MLTRLTATTPVWAAGEIFAVFGIGFSVMNAPVTNAAVSGMPTDRAGAASAIASTSRQVGVSLGVALCGSVAGAALAMTGADFATAARPLWFICAGFGVTIFALGLFSTSSRAMRWCLALAPLIEGQAEHQGLPMSDNLLADDVWRAFERPGGDSYNRDSWKRAGGVADRAPAVQPDSDLEVRLARRPSSVKQIAQAATIDAPAAHGRHQRPRRPRARHPRDDRRPRCKVVSLTEDAGRDMGQH